jgi:uncharacterized protein (DUF1778 family)
MATTAKEQRLHLRATKKQRAVIERGARMRGQNITDFVISSAYEKAELVLSEQHHFVLSPAKWDAFVTALDRPVSKHKRLARLIAEPSILER